MRNNDRIRLFGTVVAITTSSLMTSCVSPNSDVSFAVAADVFVNQTVGVEYLRYVNNDGSLDIEQKKDRTQNVESFREIVRQKMIVVR